jgi:hypothetical protein
MPVFSFLNYITLKLRYYFYNIETGEVIEIRRPPKN